MDECPLPLVVPVVLVSSYVRGPLFLISVSVQQVRVLSALVRGLEVPVDECPVQCPWCVSLLVPEVRFFLSIVHVRLICTVVLKRYKKRQLQYSQLRVIRKQENGQPPRFLGNFLDFRVRPPQFLRRPADRQGRKALVSRNWSEHPSVSFKNH